MYIFVVLEKHGSATLYLKFLQVRIPISQGLVVVRKIIVSKKEAELFQDGG